MRRNGVSVSLGVERRMVREEELGRTAVIVAINDQLVAVLGIADTVKPEAHLTVYCLKQQGLDVVLLTGQSQSIIEWGSVIFGLLCRSSLAIAKFRLA